VSEWVALQCVDADELSIKYVPLTNLREATLFVVHLHFTLLFIHKSHLFSSYIYSRPSIRSKTPHTNFKEDTFEVKILSSGSVDTGKGKTKDSGKDKDSQKDREKVCWLCEFKFTLFKRQHHCRLCDCVCCDDCSKKKALVDEAQVTPFNLTVYNIPCHTTS
jgi:hypothetical protein